LLLGLRVRLQVRTQKINQRLQRGWVLPSAMHFLYRRREFITLLGGAAVIGCAAINRSTSAGVRYLRVLRTQEFTVVGASAST